jgi:hypothetical protein
MNTKTLYDRLLDLSEDKVLKLSKDLSSLIFHSDMKDRDRIVSEVNTDILYDHVLISHKDFINLFKKLEAYENLRSSLQNTV